MKNIKKNPTFLVIGVLVITSILSLASSLVFGQTTLTAAITSPVDNSTFEAGQAIDFAASASGGSPSYGFLWNFGDGTTGAGANFTKTYAGAGAKTASLVVTDFDGARTVNSINLIIVASSTPPVVPPPPPPPVVPGPGPVEILTISNIRVTDITTVSAIVRWTTSKAATSRVIYDTVAHASITGQTAPNFGYASSTPTTDVDTKVTEHAVPVSQLSPATSYYFRVISQ